MSYAENTGTIEFNRISQISKIMPPPKKTHLPALHPDELPNVIETLNHASMHPHTRFCFYLQLHTILRPGKIVQLKWEYIDFEEMLITVPEPVMKKSRKHIIPMSVELKRILQELHLLTGHRPYLLPSIKNPRKSMHSQTLNNVLKRVGFKDELVSHGLRSIASTYLNESLKFHPDVIEAALAHKPNDDIRSAYNRTCYLKARRELMNYWSEYICASDSSKQGYLVFNSPR